MAANKKTLTALAIVAVLLIIGGSSVGLISNGLILVDDPPTWSTEYYINIWSPILAVLGFGLAFYTKTNWPKLQKAEDKPSTPSTESNKLTPAMCKNVTPVSSANAVDANNIIS